MAMPGAKRGSGPRGKIRGKGDGACYWREDRQRWIGSVDLPNGKRRTFSSRIKREVQEWLKKATQEAQNGVLLPAAGETVAQFLERWLRDVKRPPRIHLRTHQRYSDLIRLHVNPVVGRMRLDKVRGPHLLGIYREAEEKGLAAATVHYIHRVLHGAFRYAVREEIIARNPCDLADPPRVKRPEVIPYTIGGKLSHRRNCQVQ